MIYQMITGLREEGGAGVIPKTSEWSNVEAVFPLHDHAKNKKWLSEFSRKTFLSPEDLDDIKDTVGEKVRYFVNMVSNTNIDRSPTTMPSCSLTSPS